MGVKDWLFQKYAEKLIKQGIQIGIAWLVGHNIEQFGVKIDPITASASAWAAIETLRSLLKHKYGVKWL